MTDSQIERPDPAQELQYLKDFQRLSVNTVFRRMYEDASPTRRFLVADEVGLGKTLVARGVITRVIDHLWNRVPRIDIVYLCSNSDIARQNVRRLTPHGISGVSLASRITLLPIETHNLKDRKVNVIALTPGTSLDLKGNLGIRRERALLLALLQPHWRLDWTGATRLFAGYASLQKFKSYARHFAVDHDIDDDLRRAFLTAIDSECAAAAARGQPTLRDRLETLVKDFRENTRATKELNAERTVMIGELRQVLARSCIRALQPDLIVLDEFQRFKELLDGVGPAGEMAKHLFEYEDESTQTRVMLLSATPYKMYTVQDDAGNEDHYEDFLKTARFLFAEDVTSADRLGILLQEYREELFRLGRGGMERLTAVRDAIEALLRSVMVRTERLAVTPDRSGMLVEKDPGLIDIRSEDACTYSRIQAVARHVDYGDTMEFWKAAPWLLNFMDDYKLRKEIDARIKGEQSPDFLKAMEKALPSLVSFEDVAAFRHLDPAHGRLRWLIEHALGRDFWRLLWLPPTMPYHELGGPFAEAARHSPTKTLLFSAWRVVPRVVAAVLSHEAERRMYVALEGDETDRSGMPERLGDQLRIARREGRVAGLTVLSLMYPCQWFARNCDPLRMAAELQAGLGRLPTLQALVAEAEARIGKALGEVIPDKSARTAPDESWYWAAPLLLDRAMNGAGDKWFRPDLVAVWGGDDRASDLEDEDAEDASESDAEPDEGIDASGLSDLVERVLATAGGEVPGGSPPRDLVRTLALMAIAGPATVALRSFGRVTGAAADDIVARDAGARVGAAFRTLFNQPDSTAIVRATVPAGGDYWKQCLEYSAMGCLQASLDEYAHLLVGEAGVFGKSPEESVPAIAEYMESVVSLRRARVGAQNITISNGKVRSETTAFRSRYAMRFGEERADERGDRVRADEVRKAFNSPFWPFVLATTSVGQEGLDFHLYCHRVVHWNLPPNPVDLEQREGRVHRFKGHAVRKNVATRHAEAWPRSARPDPWEESFRQAIEGRAQHENDLVPYWVYTAPGGAAIERYVPSYPLSRDIERFKSLRDSLALYRMVFGQPRQEELLSYLARTVPQEKIPQLAEQLRISLAPQSAP